MVVCPLAAQQTPKDIDYGSYARLLRIYVDRQGMVNYPALERDKEILRDAVADISSVGQRKFAGLSKSGQIAMLINAYNLFTIDAVVSNWPVKRNWLTGWFYPGNSIRQISGVFDELTHQLLGTGYTLDEIENGMLREQYGDPRIHLVLVCGAIGCPRLRPTPYTADSLDVQLDNQVKDFLADPQNFRIDRDAMVVTLSEIFEEYASDWMAAGYTHLDSLAPANRADDAPGAEQRAVIEFIMGYQDSPAKSFLEAGGYKIDYSDFDWSLNIQPRVN